MADIEYAQTAHFEEITQHRRATAFQHFRAGAEEFDRIMAIRLCPREISSNANSLLPKPDCPVMSTPTSNTSKNTPCLMVEVANVRCR